MEIRNLIEYIGFSVNEEQLLLIRWICGVLMMLITTFGLALQGHLQAAKNKKYGANSRESLFWVHTFSIPLFLFFISGINEQMVKWNNSKSIEIFNNITIPEMWLLCIGNLITQYICASGVHKVVASFGSLTASLITSIRKCLTLIISVWYFNSIFSLQHWIGSILVFGGATIYVIAESLYTNEIKKKQD
eukprot:TRINITY_DN5394_c0_g1_i1.p1 TRINITY_DN5394_c0_g1~~TRINITY_DN5394_c0_g1_i1.p1  ORF type:complete len:190 (+),score=50.03 TRINITY_DN5394_c0_g1_i1:194-763(+)